MRPTLAPMIFTGVVMRTVDHDGTNDALARDNGFRRGHVFGFIVGFPASAAQHDMAIGIAHGLNDGGEPIGVDADKMVRAALRRPWHCWPPARLPSVPFLKPTGIDKPLAISRWVGFRWYGLR